jgi:thiol:disulfide interchange protein
MRSLFVSMATMLFLFSHCATGQTPEETVRWIPRAPVSVAANGHVDIHLTAKIASGWHIYSLSQLPGGPTTTEIHLTNNLARQDGPAHEPAPRHSFDPNFNIETEMLEGNVAFLLPAVFGKATPAGKQVLGIDATFQACNEETCLPPHTTHLELAIMVMGGVSATSNSLAAAASKKVAEDSTPLSSTAVAPPIVAAMTSPVVTVKATPPSSVSPDLKSYSLASFLWLAFGMGALSLLTPCVFPMVPITVSYFSNHGASDRRGAVLYAMLYGLGIILTFSALGLALALLFGAAGVNRLASSPWVNLLITAIFLMFALSLFGAYFIQLPAVWVGRLTRVTRSEGNVHALGALLMGFTFSLTSFTCTAPFVGTLLVLASQGSWRMPLMGMLAYSTVFAMPFVGLALAPQLMSHLPRSGTWMNQMKVVMGFLEIAASMKFLSNVDLVWGWGVFTRTVVLAVWIACGTAIALYIFGLFRLDHDQPVSHISVPRLIAALSALAITVALLPGLFGGPLGELDSFLPPPESERTAIAQVDVAADGQRWIIDNYPQGLSDARQQARPVFIDFTGYTCTNCRWMEANMFPQPAVKAAMSKFVTVRLYTDRRGEPYENQQKLEQDRFGTVALPLYAIVRPDGSTVATFLGLTRNPAEFLAFLHKADAGL